MWGTTTTDSTVYHSVRLQQPTLLTENNVQVEDATVYYAMTQVRIHSTERLIPWLKYNPETRRNRQNRRWQRLSFTVRFRRITIWQCFAFFGCDWFVSGVLTFLSSQWYLSRRQAFLCVRLVDGPGSNHCHLSTSRLVTWGCSWCCRKLHDGVGKIRESSSLFQVSIPWYSECRGSSIFSSISLYAARYNLLFSRLRPLLKIIVLHLRGLLIWITRFSTMQIPCLHNTRISYRWPHDRPSEVQKSPLRTVQVVIGIYRMWRCLWRILVVTIGEVILRFAWGVYSQEMKQADEPRRGTLRFFPILLIPQRIMGWSTPRSFSWIPRFYSMDAIVCCSWSWLVSQGDSLFLICH